MSLFIRVVATKDIDPVDNPAEDLVGSQSLRKGAGTSIFFFGFFAGGELLEVAGESGADDEAEIEEDSIAKASSEISGEFKPSVFSAIVYQFHIEENIL